jgi:hypothetical protein
MQVLLCEVVAAADRAWLGDHLGVPAVGHVHLHVRQVAEREELRAREAGARPGSQLRLQPTTSLDGLSWPSSRGWVAPA